MRTNDQIRIPTVRLFDDSTQEALGVVPIEKARQLATERDLDLVEIAPLATPPVCRIMDYGRFKFEALKKEKESRREHTVVHLKEQKLRPKIGEHDFRTKFNAIKKFLLAGDKVKVTIMFRGREMSHQEFGRKLLERVAEEAREYAAVERTPLVEGRNMHMILSPTARKPAKSERSGDATSLPSEVGVGHHTGQDNGEGPAEENVAEQPAPATRSTTDAKAEDA